MTMDVVGAFARMWLWMLLALWVILMFTWDDKPSSDPCDPMCQEAVWTVPPPTVST